MTKQFKQEPEKFGALDAAALQVWAHAANEVKASIVRRRPPRSVVTTFPDTIDDRQQTASEPRFRAD